MFSYTPARNSASLDLPKGKFANEQFAHLPSPPLISPHNSMSMNPTIDPTIARLPTTTQHTDGSLLSPARRAQLRRQNPNISPGTLVFDHNPLEILQFVFADLRVCG
jgi:hypothetical protein